MNKNFSTNFKSLDFTKSTIKYFLLQLKNPFKKVKSLKLNENYLILYFQYLPENNFHILHLKCFQLSREKHEKSSNELFELRVAFQPISLDCQKLLCESSQLPVSRVTSLMSKVCMKRKYVMQWVFLKKKLWKILKWKISFEEFQFQPFSAFSVCSSDFVQYQKWEKSSLVILLCFRIIYCLSLWTQLTASIQWRFEWMREKIFVTWRIIFKKEFSILVIRWELKILLGGF